MECVLDVDSAGREPQKQAAKNYHYDQPRNPKLFRFEPIPLSFEPVDAAPHGSLLLPYKERVPQTVPLSILNPNSYAFENGGKHRHSLKA